MLSPTALAFAVAMAFLITGCSSSAPTSQAALTGTPAMKQATVPWWRQLNDSSLNRDIQSAISKNPNLETIALRIEQAEAAVANARATMLPTLNLGFGYRAGRGRNIDFGPYTLAPWEMGGNLSWEADLTGRLRSAKRASEANATAAVWDYKLAQLLLASRVAATRLNLYRFNAEIASLGDSLQASQDTLATLIERNTAGLIANSAVSNQRAENEKLTRLRLDLVRLRDLTIVQLRTLRGGSEADKLTGTNFPDFKPYRPLPLDQILANHPSLLAAEAQVRAAYEMENSARLNLLPSFRFNALASGRTTSLTNRYQAWITTIGPSLDLPVYDPARLAALKLRKARRATAAANYRAVALKVLQEIDTATINLKNYRAQLAAARREVREIKTTRGYAREQFNAGLTSQIEYLDAERRLLEANRSVITLEQATLNSSLELIKATGGGILW